MNAHRPNKELPSIKLLMLGDQEAGKTCLLFHYAGQPTTQSSPTVGVDLVCTEVEINDITFKAKIWDTAGTEKYRSMNRNFYKGAIGVLLVYDVSKNITKEQLEGWDKELSYIPKKPSVVVVANKIELGVNKESSELLQNYCKQHKYPYIQTSAVEGTNVSEAYSSLLRSIGEKQNIKKILKESSESFVLSIAPHDYSYSGPNLSKRKCQC